jgi:uncharacterized protein YbcI
MTDKSLESRIKKLEERFSDLKDSTEDAQSSIEDLYDSLNNLKALPSYDSRIPLKNNNDSTISLYNNPVKSVDKFLDKPVDNPVDNPVDKNDIHCLLGKYNLLPASETYILAEGFGNLLLKNLFPSKQQLIEMLEYFLTRTTSEQLEIYNKIGNPASNDFNKLSKDKPKMLAILELGLSSYYRHQVICKLQLLEKMDSQDAEYCKLSQWMDNLLSIPFTKYTTPKYISTYLEGKMVSNKGNAKDILKTARAELDNVIYGQQATKTHILEIIARMISNPSTTGTVFAVEGVPGCGKTTLIKEGLSKILDLPFEFISLGGASEAAYLAGQNYTYIGSGPGKIIQALKQAKCMNPIFYFDELDKVSKTERGQEIMNLLIHLTDPAQNSHFQDQYMDGIPVDLSRAIFIFSFNNRCLVNQILLDRMEVIRFHTYTPADKSVIIEKHLIPQIMKKYFGNSAARIRCIFKNKKQVIKILLSRPERASSSDGVIKKKTMRAKSLGIRTIIRRIDNAIAKLNLALLEDGWDITKIKKVILTTKMFCKNTNKC